YLELILFNFFFSSRRRHTRSKRDWSSDVCSSDLLCQVLQEIKTIKSLAHLRAKCAKKCLPIKGPLALTFVRTQCNRILPDWNGRSEERRVGKECRRRGRPYSLQRESRSEMGESRN